MQPSLTPAPPANPIARVDRAFPWHIGGALVVAVAGGFVLAVLLPLAAALGWEWGARWRALVQAHGHLQTAGWAGLFVVGMGRRLLPRFAGRPLAYPGLSAPVLALLLGGLLGRALAQPWLDVGPARALLTVAALAELGGALLFAAAVAGTVGPVARTLAGAPLFLLGAAGFVAQAALGVWWLPALTAADPALSPDRTAALLALQFDAFLLPFILGVSLRALPTLFGRELPTVRDTAPLALALAAGALLHVAGRLSGVSATAARIEAISHLLVAAALLGGAARTGVWRPAARLRPTARHLALLLKTAYAWLTLGALALLWLGGHGLLTGRAAPPATLDALRHLLALGVVSTLIVGMAYLVLPWLAMRRASATTARRETRALWALLTLATVLRVGSALLEGHVSAPARYLPMAAAGVLALIAIASFAVIVLRAARARPADLIPLHERPPHPPTEVRT